MKFSITDFLKCDQIRRKLRIWSHLLKKSVMENIIFGAVVGLRGVTKKNIQMNRRYSFIHPKGVVF